MVSLPASRLPTCRRPELAVAALLTALCLALPTRNPSGDAWYYAACARWGHELAQPHHLLYNYVGWWWLRLLGATGPAPAGQAAMPWLQALNSLALGGCLLALGPLLRRAGARPAAVPAWLLAVGSSFGMLRFAVENEAYVQPLLLALLASLAWARAVAGRAGAAPGLPNPGPAADQSSAAQPATTVLPAASRMGWLLLAGLLAALACLVHQMLVWWWLGLLLGLQPWRGRVALRNAVAYAAPAALVPLDYWLAAPPAGGLPGVLRFALHDYLTGGARVELSWQSLVLTPIGLVRTLGQVHGNLLPLLHRWPLPLGTVAVGCLALGVYSVVKLKSFGFQGRGNHLASAVETAPVADGGFEKRAGAARQIRRAHLLIFGLQLTFAAQAAGNAEFMVMLPALAAVAWAGGPLRSWPGPRVAAFGTALLAWNLAFGLLPAHTLQYATTGPVLRAQQRQPGAWFLLLDPNLLRNQLHYYTGQPASPPRVLGLVGPAAPPFRRWLRQRLAAGDTVYTDALGGPRPLDRARLTLGDPAAALLGGFPSRRVLVLPTFFGPGYLSRLMLPAEAPNRAAQPSASASATVNTGAAR